MNGVELSERNEKGKFYKDFLQIRSEILNDLEKDIKRREKMFWEALDIQLKKLEKTEFWKDIEGYEGLYQISSFGRVKSLSNDKARKEKIKIPESTRGGYKLVNLWKNGEQKGFLVHRLVASAFLPNPNNYPCINHKDENKSNNCLENLEWCTVKYNINYGTRTEKCSKKVEQYDLKGKLIKTWKSLMEIQRQLGYAIGNISNCCNGKRSTAYGYTWQYV